MPDDTTQDAPLTGADLRTYLQSQDNFAFEREVPMHADGCGLMVQHAGLYEDPATSKMRQFDLRAFKSNGNHRIRLAIECKSLRPTYPLVVSCVPRPPEESYHCAMFTRPEPGQNSRRWDYNEHRPHRSLEGLTPREFAARAST